MTTPTDAPPTTAAALAARGYPVTLKDGRQVPIVYDFLSLLLIEETYGSIGGLLEKVDGLGGEAAMHGPVMGVVIDLISFALDETRDRPDRQRATARLLDLRRMQEYVSAATASLKESFGPEVPASASDVPGGRQDPTGASTGSSGGPTP